MMETIIFDFGGVVLNIDFQKTIEAFTNLGMKNAEEMYSKYSQSSLFVDLEKGCLDPDEFRSRLKELFNIRVSDETIDTAWNALLLDLPVHRVKQLEKIKKNYKILLLSNTNRIHYNHYINDIQKLGYSDYDALFHHAVFSFKIGMVKPHPEIWKYIINEYNLNPSTTLFIDDSIVNVEAAQNFGFNAFHLKEGMEFSNLFNESGKLKDRNF